MKVVVSAVAFSKNLELVNILLEYFPGAILNTEGKRFTFQELASYYKEADAIITGLEKIDKTLLSQLPNLKFISKYGVGLDNIDLEACAQRNIKIGWTPGVNKNSVAEMALGFILMLCRNLYTTSNQLKKNLWNKNGGFSLQNKTVGIIGFGNIGRELARLLQPFNVNIIANDIIPQHDINESFNIEFVEFNELLSKSDIISIHTPLDATTLNLINNESIRLMKDGVVLINTARGGVINENDLKDGLHSGKIAGAAIDVYSIEPPVDTDLLAIENLITTPHIAGNSYEAVLAMGLEAINHLRKFQKDNYNKKI